jgi:hypothetical protein
MRHPLLPSRASNSSHCEECDGDRDNAGPLCSDCDAATTLQRIEWRYQNGEGVVDMYDSKHWEVSRWFNPLHWEFGVSVHLGHDESFFVLGFGPLGLSARWAR